MQDPAFTLRLKREPISTLLLATILIFILPLLWRGGKIIIKNLAEERVATQGEGRKLL
jgi:hypothetical protein